MYESRGYCKAITNPWGEDIQMMASWGEMQFGDSECLLADTYDPETKRFGGDPYIIDKRAFEETYIAVDIGWYISSRRLFLYIHINKDKSCKRRWWDTLSGMELENKVFLIYNLR